MNIYYYLFYKLSRVLNDKGNNEWGPIGAMTFLIGLNMLFAYIRIFSVTKVSFEERHKVIVFVGAMGLFVLNTILFLNKKRRKRIIDRYKELSLKRQKTGSFFVMAYVVLTLLSIFFI